MKFNLNELVPQEVQIEFSEKPGKKYTLKKFSLRVQAWAFEKYGPEKLKELLDKKHLPTVAEIAHHLLKDSTDFPTAEDFMEAVVTQHDRVNLITALVKVIGFSQPVIDRIVAEDIKQQGELRARSQKSTGGKSTTPSRASTATK